MTATDITKNNGKKQQKKKRSKKYYNKFVLCAMKTSLVGEMMMNA